MTLMGPGTARRPLEPRPLLWRAVRTAMGDAERAARGVLRHNSRLCPRCAYPLRPARNAAGWCPECELNAPITNPGAG